MRRSRAMTNFGGRSPLGIRCTSLFWAPRGKSTTAKTGLVMKSMEGGEALRSPAATREEEGRVVRGTHPPPVLYAQAKQLELQMAVKN